MIASSGEMGNGLYSFCRDVLSGECSVEGEAFSAVVGELVVMGHKLMRAKFK